MNKKALLKFIYILYLIAIIAFIFSNSLPSIKESAEASGRLLKFINGLLDVFRIPTMSSDVFIRKAAHFTEFFVLGGSLFGYTFFDKKSNFTSAVNCAFFSCLIAMADETIQYFTGRGSMLLDVWLDLLGAITAIIIFYYIGKRKQIKNSR